MTESLREMLIRHEGRRHRPYKCTAGKWTIGVGFNYSDNPLPTDIQEALTKKGEITDEMIDRLLDMSVRHAAADAHVLFPDLDSYSPARKNALIDWMFQLGFNTARKFTTSVRLIKEQKWKEAANAMRQSAWAKQTPNRAKEITRMIEEG